MSMFSSWMETSQEIIYIGLIQINFDPLSECLFSYIKAISGLDYLQGTDISNYLFPPSDFTKDPLND